MQNNTNVFTYSLEQSRLTGATSMIYKNATYSPLRKSFYLKGLGWITLLVISSISAPAKASSYMFEGPFSVSINYDFSNSYDWLNQISRETRSENTTNLQPYFLNSNTELNRDVELTSPSFLALDTALSESPPDYQLVTLDTNENGSCEVLDQSGESQEEIFANTTNNREGIILDYEIYGSSLYSESSDLEFRNNVHSIIAPYLGKIISSADLKAIQDAITLLYLRDGYVTSRAESVTIQANGMLTVRVIEGFICEVRVRSRDTQSSAAEAVPIGSRILAYLEPDVFSIPTNFSQIERRIRSLSQDERIEEDQTAWRLISLAESFSDRYLRYLRSAPQNDQSEQEQSGLELGTFIEENADSIITPGASILEIEFEPRERVEQPDDSPVERLSGVSIGTSIPDLENDRLGDFEGYFGSGFDRRMVDPTSIRFALHSLESQEPAIKAAVVYVASDEERVFIRAETSEGQTIEIESITRFEVEVAAEELEFEREGDREGQLQRRNRDDEDNPSGEEVYLSSLESSERVERDELVEEVENLWDEIQKPNSDNYRQYSDKLYNLLIRPVEQELEKQEIDGINTLLFVMEKDLRLLPVAALYDSETDQFLAEKYNVSIIPNFTSLDLRPSDLTQASILSIGISEFRDPDTYSPLQAVPLELELIDRVWRNTASASRQRRLQNEDSTLVNLRNERREHPFQIIHLATHANFRPGEPGDSSIQLWDTTIPLNPFQIATLNWSDPPVDLLVLSACQTAFGDEKAELGFAGLSLQSEVKSVLASLWPVRDLASSLYMMEFYRNLTTGVTKAEAVRNTQMAMLDEQRLKQNLGELKIVIRSLLADNRRFGTLTEAEEQGLEQMLENLNTNDAIAEIAESLTHPAYWSTYTLVGSPW